MPLPKMMLDQLAKLLGLPFRVAEEALHSESYAQGYLNRRNFLGGLGALCAGTTFSFPSPETEVSMGAMTVTEVVIPKWSATFGSQELIRLLEISWVPYPEYPIRDFGPADYEVIKHVAIERSPLALNYQMGSFTCMLCGENGSCSCLYTATRVEEKTC